MRVAIYARVSTTSGQSPEMRLSDMRECGSRRGWEVFAEYIDNGVSGAKGSRPELNHVMGDAHGRHFDVVLCWKIGLSVPPLDPRVLSPQLLPELVCDKWRFRTAPPGLWIDLWLPPDRVKA
jgi:hypothetical protein